MTTEQKNKIVSMRKAGHGYTAVAREVGLSKSAVSNFCRENGLAGKAYIPAGAAGPDQQKEPAGAGPGD